MFDLIIGIVAIAAFVVLVVFSVKELCRSDNNVPFEE